jgi:hypothetical protein
VTDPRLAELSGMTVVDGRIWAMPDGGRRVQLYEVDPDGCAITATRTADVDPEDPEDLAAGPDGSLWVSDTGDNDRRRGTVAVIVLPARGDPRLHRLTYPDGPHDAEALLVDGAGRPVVVTKEVGRPTGVYRTEFALDGTAPEGPGPMQLRRIGDLPLPASDTPGGPIGQLGPGVVTGAGATVDGGVVALRTYTDAWLYRVRDGDVAAALVAGPALRIPLPDEPQGEAIAFAADGSLLSGSEARGGVRGEIRSVPGAVGLLDAARDGRASPAEPAAPADPPSAPEWGPAAAGAGALAALLLLLAGAVTLRNRNRH